MSSLLPHPLRVNAHSGLSPAVGEIAHSLIYDDIVFKEDYDLDTVADSTKRLWRVSKIQETFCRPSIPTDLDGSSVSSILGYCRNGFDAFMSLKTSFPDRGSSV